MLVRKYQIPIEEEDWKRVDIRYFTMELYPLSNDTVNCKMVANIDPNCWYLPSAFYKFIAKTSADFLINKIYKLSKEAHQGEWGQKINDNPEFYTWVRKIVFSYLSWLELDRISANNKKY